MATKVDTRAAKQRKQKIILAVGGVLFLALAAIQGPKLVKQLRPAEASTKPAVSSTSAAPASPAAPVAARVVPAGVPKSQKTSLAGVILVAEQRVKPGDDQLDSFTEFEAKDPFVQQIVEKSGATSGAASSPASASSTPAPQSPAAGAGAPGTGTSVLGAAPGLPAATPTKPAAPTAAILKVNGVMQALEPKQRFPKGEPVFVLLSLKRGLARIGVVGGSYANGDKAITIRVGKPVTLLNTATGVRYVVRLVYVGADAGALTGFVAPAPTTSKSK